jgi:hypothetical protein
MIKDKWSGNMFHENQPGLNRFCYRFCQKFHNSVLKSIDDNK